MNIKNMEIEKFIATFIAMVLSWGLLVYYGDSMITGNELIQFFLLSILLLLNVFYFSQKVKEETLRRVMFGFLWVSALSYNSFHFSLHYHLDHRLFLLIVTGVIFILNIVIYISRKPKSTDNDLHGEPQ